MLRDEVVRIIAQKLNNRTDLDEIIVAEMQLAQAFRLEQNGKFQPWFMVTTKAITSATAGNPVVQMPSDFVLEVEEQGLWIFMVDSGEWFPLTKMPEDEATDLYRGTGTPQVYSLASNYLTLHPTPQIDYQIRMRYAAAQSALSSNIENAWLKYAADLVIAEVGEYIALENMQNEKLALGFRNAKNESWARLRLMHESRQHTNRIYTMGEE